MDQKKSSRKINVLAAILILLIGVFVGGYLVLKSGKISAGELNEILKGQTIDLALCEPNVNDATSDADNDGLKDWQEIQLYKTDSCKQDSDSDGYFDGEEVASGYDPAQKAPGDELPGTTPKSPRPLPNNLTIALQQKLSEQIRQDRISPLDADGNLLSSRELEQFPGIQQAVWEVSQHKDQIFAPDPIELNEIKTTTDNSLESIQLYIKKVSECVSCNDQLYLKIEAQIFLDAIQNNDFTEATSQLREYPESYQKLKSLTVPSDFLTLHIQIMNILSGSIKVYQAIINVTSDPLKANLALQQYEVFLNQTIQWAQNFETTLNNHH